MAAFVMMAFCFEVRDCGLQCSDEFFGGTKIRARRAIPVEPFAGLAKVTINAFGRSVVMTT